MGINFFEMNCRQATVLVERKLTHGLPFWQQWRLSWHQQLCSVCKTYEQQSTIIEQVMTASQESIYKLSDEQKAAILQKLKGI